MIYRIEERLLIAIYFYGLFKSFSKRQTGKRRDGYRLI